MSQLILQFMINKKYVFFKIDKNIPSNQIVGNIIEF